MGQKRSGRCEKSLFVTPRAPRSAAMAGRWPRCAPTTWPRFRSRHWSPATPRPTGRGSTRCFSAAPTSPARTTAMSRAWRSCSPGCRHSVPGVTVNRLCASGLNAVGDAARAIRTGEMDFAIAGGVESMTRAPFVMGKAGEAFSRSAEIFDTTLGWRFINPLMQGAIRRRLDGRNRRERRRGIPGHPRRSGRFRAALAAARRQGHRHRLFRQGDRPGRGAQRQSRAVVVDEDEHPRPDTTHREPAKAQAHRAHARHRHGRQCVGHQ